MLCDIEADNLAAVVGQYEHYEQQPEGCRRHDEHVDGSDAECLVAQEAAPTRRWGVRSEQHVLGNGRLAELDAELKQLAVNAGRTPEWVGNAHLADQFASLASYRPSTRLRAPTPVEPKALPMPLDYGGRLHHQYRLQAAGPHLVEPDPQHSIDGA